MSAEVAPLVSIIMPFFNGAKYLRDAIGSVLNQTFSDFEFILVNDGSTDNAPHIAKSIVDSRIRYFDKENSGVADTLNFAIAKAQGKYIWRHDADDTCHPGKLASQMYFMEQHPEFALCATQIAFMTEKGNIAWNYRQPRNEYFNGNQFIEVSREHFNPYSPITHATILIKTDVMRKLNGYRTDFKTAEDVDLWLRLLNSERAAVINQCNYYVRLNSGSATSLQGWKNEFFRNLAFLYDEQRKMTGQDDLQRGQRIVLPFHPAQNIIESAKSNGQVTRHDLLDFIYPLHLNARDYKTSWDIIRQSVREGWKLPATWKAILFPLLGKKLVQKGVQLKRKLSW